MTMVGDEAADDIATVLSYNTQLQELHLHNNNIQARGAITITKALINTSTLVNTIFHTIKLPM